MIEQQRPSFEESVLRIFYGVFSDFPASVTDRIVHQDLHGQGIVKERRERAMKWAKEQEKCQDPDIKKP
jgi:hypothetical protein